MSSALLIALRPCCEPLEPRALLAGVTFTAIGDYGEFGQPEADVANLVKGWNPDFIITTGDNNYPDGAASTIDPNIGQYYHDFIGQYQGVYGTGAPSNRFFPSLGNHDWIAPGAQPFLDYFSLPGNERYYDFVRGPVHFFVIDSDPHEPDGITSASTQGTWLRQRLAESTAPWQIVYMHHPPYSSSSRHGSTPALQWPFQQWGADAVLAGHDHVYERIQRDGIVYFTNGLGGRRSFYGFGSPVPGSQVRYNGDYGAMRAVATNTSIKFDFVTRAGTLIDSHTINKPSERPLLIVAAPDRLAAEEGSDGARFKITRAGDTSALLRVRYSIGGTAGNGTDYEWLNGTIAIKPGRSAANVYVMPLDDSTVEPTEGVRLRLADRSAYVVNSSRRDAVVHIADNDHVPFASTAVRVEFTYRYDNDNSVWAGLHDSDNSDLLA